ncbi:helix-turn-helix transcriptional regulator [Macrococcoides canis]|uniref:helix-turn-helix transcriptional regulator n=1 Tax=Macrococcoides canis TaxID=1855823 RepID=UPI0022B86EA4|nr:hypothetical protein [Macrococcus canis]WBF51997.1 hypothetical protein LL975_07765 [Macrococcus canis]
MEKKISDYRKFIGLTQKNIAKLLDISVQAYRNKEKGRTPFSDSEKVIIKELINENGFPQLTIDDIFFRNKVAKK